jgi:hypothetical protein
MRSSSPVEAKASAPNPRPAGEPPADPVPIDSETDTVGWHVSSFELRRGLTVIDLDDAVWRELFFAL